MTNLNYNELLQTEIDKVQGYVNGKVDSITVTEVQLLKDKAQLVELEDKLNVLLEEQKTFVEFLESKNTKVKTAKSKPSVATGAIKASKGEAEGVDGSFTGIIKDGEVNGDKE